MLNIFKSKLINSYITSNLRLNFYATMENSSLKCYLRSVENNEHIIDLPHRIPIAVGRDRSTSITDLFISKNQLLLTANLETNQVVAKNIGICNSGCNGFALMQNERYFLKHGDRLEIRLGCHFYDIVFEPPPDSVNEKCKNNEEPPHKKAKLNFPIFEFKKPYDMDDPLRKLYVKGNWEEIDNRALLVYTPDNVKHRPNIAAFDLDGTIIKTKSGLKFPKDTNDWMVNMYYIPQKLKDLLERKYKIVIFSNQSSLSRDSSRIKEFKLKIEQIVSTLRVPIQVFIATGKSIYRKPAPGMWNSLSNDKNGDITINVNHSFYVGDAAGRKENWYPKKSKDHSIGDRLFAINLNLKFYTPEEYFLKKTAAPYVMPEFDPRNIELHYEPINFDEKQEIIIMVGGPGSGKSHYCKNHLIPKGYIHVNRDTLGTWQLCIKLLEASIKQKRSAVIDNTNGDKESRKRYIDVVKKYNLPLRCFIMSTTFKHSKHNNKFREFTDKSHTKIGDIVLHTYKKIYQEPTVDEGFSEIIKVPFIPKFQNTDQENLYKMFLLES